MFTIGFTGTRTFLTGLQYAALKRELQRVLQDVELRGGTRPEGEGVYGVHGDCLGADKEFDQLFRHLCGKDSTRCRPCTINNMRAYTGAVELAEPKPPMQRNWEIVANADIMLACPPNKEPIKSGSGTWATIKFTRRAGKPLVIVFPDGTVEREEGK